MKNLFESWRKFAESESAGNTGTKTSKVRLNEDTTSLTDLALDLRDQTKWKTSRAEMPRDLDTDTSKEKYKSMAASGRILKKMFAKHADHSFMDSLVTVHWTGDKYWKGAGANKVFPFLKGEVSSKDELSTVPYLPGQVKDHRWGPYGIVVKGHITLLANDMDDIFTGASEGYSTSMPERTKSSGTNKGVATSFKPDDYGPATQPILVLDKEDWKPSISDGFPKNEALVDNWKITALIAPENKAGMLERVIEKLNLNIPVVTYAKTDQLNEAEEEEAFDRFLEKTFGKVAAFFGSRLGNTTEEISQEVEADKSLDEGVLFGLGITLAAPAIVKLFTGIAKVFGNTIKGWTGKDLGIEKVAEKINHYADKFHHLFHKPIEFFVRKILRIKEDTKVKQATDLLFHLLVVFLMVYSGVGAANAATSGKTGLAGFESLLAAVKAGEVRAYLLAALKTIATGSKATT